MPFQAPRCFAPLQAPVVEPVEVGEDPVLVFKNADHDAPLSLKTNPARAGRRTSPDHCAASFALPRFVGSALGMDFNALAAEPS